ncbi:hypothetical protein BS17DRAFT_765765 [Gyrodon lividus]|nr:hypothetical protein BS17DRAFT_765765 [Gyrodon lividus]
MANQKKIDDLKLTEEEWKRVKLFASLLAHADHGQQSFSSGQESNLQHAFPALEALHRACNNHSESEWYEPFKDGLNAATEKLVEYYERTADSDTYTLVMFLDPSQKDLYFKKYWGKELHAQVLKNVEGLFKECFIKLYGKTGGPALDQEENRKASTTFT